MKQKIPITVISVSFVLLHLACLAVFFVAFSWWAVLMGVALYLLRMFAVTAGYHRYFAHRTYRLNRFNQFAMAFAAQTSAQKGVLWWAAHHRDHHRFSDTEQDIHSPIVRSFWWAHMGWVLSDKFDGYNPANISDFEKFPELRFLNDYHWICPWLLGTAVFALGHFTEIGGLSALVWGFFLSTVLLFHGTFSINSLSHLWGRQRFQTGDHSRNNFVLAMITLGEGWHNNHHHFMNACRQGIKWWEVDLTYYTLKLMSWARIVKDIRPYPESARVVAQP